MSKSKVFVACAMSGLSCDEYEAKKQKFTDIVNNSDKDVFCELTTIEHGNFETSKDATMKDLAKIDECDEFVLVHMSTVQSSTLFELGCAFALHKNITIYCKSIESLPFMLQELNEVAYFVSIVVISDESEIVL